VISVISGSLSAYLHSNALISCAGEAARHTLFFEAEGSTKTFCTIQAALTSELKRHAKVSDML